MQPLNECGVPKLVCLTIRPSPMPQPQLADLGGIAGFVADYIIYEQLEFPNQPPRHLVSPQTVVNWQARSPHDLSFSCSLPTFAEWAGWH